MKLEVDKYYVTRGGYVVHIIEHPNILFYASIKSFLGVSTNELCVNKNNEIRSLYLKGFGWGYTVNGSIFGLNSEWQEKLTIVEELPCPFPEKLPEGYKWAGGFPQFRKPENGEFYFSNGLQSVLIMQNPYSSPVDSVYSGKRFILESVSMSKTTSTESAIIPPTLPSDCEFTSDPPEFRIPKKGEFYYQPSINIIVEAGGDYYTDPYYIVRKKSAMNYMPPLPKLPNDYEFTSTPPKYDYPKCGDYYTSTGSIIDCANFDYINNKYFIVKKKDSQKLIDETPPLFPVPVVTHPRYPKYFQSNDRNTAFVKVLSDDEYRLVDFDGQESLSLHGPISPRFDYRCEFTEQEALALLNPKVISFKYWVTEPIGNMVKMAKKSVRYIVITSVLSASTYTVMQPAKVVSFVKSCLPKVSIKFNS